MGKNCANAAQLTAMPHRGVGLKSRRSSLCRHILGGFGMAAPHATSKEATALGIAPLLCLPLLVAGLIAAPFTAGMSILVTIPFCGAITAACIQLAADPKP